MNLLRFHRHIFSTLIWFMGLFLLVILYHYTLRYAELGAETLATIDMLYASLKIFFITGIIHSMVSLLFYKIEHSRAIDTKVIRRFLPIFRFFINLTIWVIAGFFILEALYINTRNILAGAGIGGAILALASKDIITNLLWSLSILFSQTFEIGDTIRIRTMRLWVEGLVEEITLNHTKVTNNTGEVVYVPNKTIYAESVENLSRRRFFSYEYSIPFAKNTPASEVDTTLKIIEWKISTYYPIEVNYKAENPNATDYLYRIEVKLPEENRIFDTDMRKFLIPYIFSRESGSKKSSQEKEKGSVEEVEEDFTND